MEKSRNRTVNFLCCIFIFFGISFTIIDPLIPLISEKLNIGYDRIGLILLVSSSVSLVATFLSGRFSDRYSLKKIIILGLILVLVGFLIYGIYFNLAIFILTLILFRSGCGILDSSVHTYAARLYYRQHGPVFIKLDFFWYIGAIISPLAISIILLLNLEPKFAFFAFALATLLIVIFFSKISSDVKTRRDKDIKDYEISIMYETEDPKTKDIIGARSYFAIIKNKIIVFSCLGLFLFIGLFSILSTWLTTYLKDFNIPISFGSIMLSVFWIFNALGVFIISKIIKSSNEISLLLLCTIMGVISTIVYCLVPVIYVKVVFLIFQAVFYSSLFPLLNAVAVHENVEASGTVLGTTISVSIVGLIVFQPLTGYLMEWFGKNGINYLLLGVAVIVFAAIFILFKLVSTKYKTRFKILKY